VESGRIPPHVEYSLTESCKQLLPALEIINEWGKEKMLVASCTGSTDRGDADTGE
jgi:DNA-binding HxlR family transcriptional regulator